MADYYSLLGVRKEATTNEIRSAYRRNAKMYHPDVNKSPDANSRFLILQTAYETLIDPLSREKYNQRLFHKVSPASSMESYEEWLKVQRAKAEYEAKLRYYEFMRTKEKFRQSKYYNLAIIVTHIARFVCYLFGAAIIAVCLYLIVDYHFVLLFFLLPFICGGVFLIKWSHEWYIDTKRYF